MVLAATATPWPGTVALYQAAGDANYTLNTTLSARAVVGLTKTDLAAGPCGVWDNGAALHVKLMSGGLERAQVAEVLAGSNLAAIGDGSPDNWELIQFVEAELVGTHTYALTQRLRGQQGSDALMPPVWPAGSWFVLLNGSVQQVDLSANLRGVSQHYRIGPAQRGYDDPSYTHLEHAFAGNGLRPYAPCHLRAEAVGEDLAIHWVRRSRVESDTWEGDVPVGEESEAYVVRVLRDGAVLRSVTVQAPSWTYGAAERAADGAMAGGFEIAVAQVSSRYGPGLAARLAL